jgi:hypothetical protein
MAGARAFLVLATALSAAAAAQAQGEPSAFGEARLGSLTVVAGVVVATNEVEMRGGWLDGKAPCAAKRRLTVAAVIDYVPPAGKGRAVHRRGAFAAANCGEAGPNVGWTLRARAIGLGCPSGAWRPGHYSFSTTAAEPTKHLKAAASLLWQKTGRC